MSGSMNMTDEQTRKRHEAEKAVAQKRAIAKLTTVCSAAGLEVSRQSAVMVDRAKDRVDIFPRISVRLSQLLREDTHGG